MRLFSIATDSASDLPEEYLKEHDVDCISLSCIIDGVAYGEENKLDIREFYAGMRSGKLPTTNAVNPDAAKKCFLKHLDQGETLLFIAFSSGLSTTYNSARLAAEEIKEENPDAPIYVIDSLCASLGQGLLVHKAVQMRDAGKTVEDTVQWLEENKLHLCHQFTVDDLFHLHRGGRVSKATAIVGTMINVKPVLHVDDEGHLISLCNVRGRRKALNKLVDNMGECIGGFEDQNDIVFISHGDCEEDANYVVEQVKSRFGIQNFLLSPLKPVIGSHAGPGTVALFFMGSKR